MKQIKNAYAKINLGLDVLSQREDGYHNVRMIMQTVSLYDTLTFISRQDGAIHISADVPGVPCDETNLIYKAAKALFAKTGKSIGVDIALQKRIPMAAGMAGGSTDAAATLLALNEWLPSPLSKEKLLEIAVGIGADVPYCITGGTALAEGIGEILTKLPAPPAADILIVKPDISVSTAFVYRNLDLTKIDRHPDIDGMVHALREGDLRGVTDRMENVLESVTIPAYPIIGRLKEICKREGALNALMSGSGPTVFAVFDDKEKACRAKERIEKEDPAEAVWIARFENLL